MDKYVFAITGGTGAGKSTVSDIFRKLGVYIIDADKVARNVTSDNLECIDELRQCFGDSIFCNNKLLRSKLAEIVFNDKEKLKLLNSITHKYIYECIKSEIDNANCPIIAIDGAVIIGSKVMELCDKIVVVTADFNTRINRIINRDNISNELANSRIQSQMSNEEYASYADYIIENNDNNVRLGECIEEIYCKIKNFSEARSAKTKKNQTEK